MKALTVFKCDKAEESSQFVGYVRILHTVMTSLYRKMGGCLLVPRRTVKYLTSDSRWRWGLITLPVSETGKSGLPGKLLIAPL
ncbi:hypothetical protein BHM03_00014039 [Ensete ventricosum]|nr:hypothetical protein BHM03_00014039 [Ensete ventricosum]